MLRILVLCFVFSFSYSYTSGQITQKNWLVGGNGSYSSTKAQNSSGSYINRHLELDPNMGYFFADKIAGGVRAKLILDRYIWSSDSESDSKAESLGLGPFLRYYLLPVDKIFNLFTEANYTYNFVGFSSQHPSKSNAFGFMAGAVFFLNYNVGIEFTSGYTIITTMQSHTKQHRIQVGLGFQIHLERE